MYIAEKGSVNEIEHLFGSLQESALNCPFQEAELERLRVAFDRANERAVGSWGKPVTDMKFEELGLFRIEGRL